jgi:hypothetical protein
MAHIYRMTHSIATEYAYFSSAHELSVRQCSEKGCHTLQAPIFKKKKRSQITQLISLKRLGKMGQEFKASLGNTQRCHGRRRKRKRRKRRKKEEEEKKEEKEEKEKRRRRGRREGEGERKEKEGKGERRRRKRGQSLENEQIIPKISRREDVIRSRIEMNKTGNRKTKTKEIKVISSKRSIKLTIFR